MKKFYRLFTFKNCMAFAAIGSFIAALCSISIDNNAIKGIFWLLLFFYWDIKSSIKISEYEDENV